jgi:hypothetical protein
MNLKPEESWGRAMALNREIFSSHSIEAIVSDHWIIDYAAFLAAAEKTNADSVAEHLAEHLPSAWLDVYRDLTPHPINVQRVIESGFTYVYDWYSQFEVTGKIPFSKDVEDRMVGALGFSRKGTERRNVARQRGWVGPTEKHWGKENDKGHFVAHTLGGGLEINVFVQRRDLNRGWSTEGKLYRSMEKFCWENPGTFFFHRPFYSDCTSRPSALEFGVLKPSGELWIERFKN